MSWEPPFSTGTESAEPTGLRRLLRQPGSRNLLVAGTAILVGGIFLVPRGQPGGSSPRFDHGLAPSPDASPSTPISVGEAAEGVTGTPVNPSSLETPASSSIGSPAASTEDRALYTIYLYELPGLAPDSRPGTTLDIWVTWKPPLTSRPKVNVLLEDVELGRIEAGFEQGPVADLLVSEDDVPDLIYGERFGSLNAVVRPT